MLATWLGTVVYEEALTLQRRLVSARAAGDIDDVVLLLEHDRVYTAGRHADISAHVLGTTGIRVVPTDRGGDVTYHGPGQLVAYPITLLAHPKAARSYVAALQEACVGVAAHYGLEARGDAERTGVWVGQEKLAAIGVRIDRGVTSHGLALNVAINIALLPSEGTYIASLTSSLTYALLLVLHIHMFAPEAGGLRTLATDPREVHRVVRGLRSKSA
jgi:lipoyl(octanoyl) transferase